MTSLKHLYRIEDGILAGTEIEQILAFVAVKYPHRKTKDLYIPPMKTEDKEIKTWHCCQDNCPAPDFEGGLDALVEHLMLHRGRLLKPWSRRQQLKSPMPAVRLPPNPWREDDHQGVNHDRWFTLSLYIISVKAALKKQGLTAIETVLETARGHRRCK